jgi:hypothetical protein
MFAQRLGEPDLKSSTGWLFRFRNGHGVANRQICGESLCTDDVSAEIIREIFRRILEEGERAVIVSSLQCR